ncbi:MAG: DUF72 domain-containing protein [Nitrososphaeria archaeon]
MAEYLIGTGGWAYFNIPGRDSLEEYSRIYNFVEVNASFYRTIPLRLVESWRKRVPPNFEFSVRLNKIVSHKYEMEANEITFKLFEYTKKMCRVLKSETIVIETPDTLEYSDHKVRKIADFLSSLNPGSIRLAWEVRRRQKQLPSALIDLMKEHNIIHIIDLSKDMPLYESDQIYSRLFGKGEHNMYQFTDEELLNIYDKTQKRKYEKVILTFHGVRMYKDAARLNMYLKEKRFPSVTKHQGLRSLEAVLSEDTDFPISKEDLIRNQGWKVMDLTKQKRIHVSEMLIDLPKRVYKSVDEIISFCCNY